MVAAVAAQEPQMAPNPAQAATVPQAREPGSRESHLLQALYRPSLSPASKAKLPIITNMGTTIRVYDPAWVAGMVRNRPMAAVGFTTTA